MKFFAVSLLAVLATGCASATYQIDPSFTPEEESAIMNGFSEWDAYGDLAPVAVNVVRVTDDKTKDGCDRSAFDAGELAITYPTSTAGRVKMCLFVPEIQSHTVAFRVDYVTALTQIAAHEYGHAMGLDHELGSRASIMHARPVDSTMAPTTIDIVNARVSLSH